MFRLLYIRDYLTNQLKKFNFQILNVYLNDRTIQKTNKLSYSYTEYQYWLAIMGYVNH